MDELLELKQKLLQGDILAALAIVDELEEMSLSDKMNNIRGYAIILLKHLIKQKAENRSVKSWEVYIQNSVWEIRYRNQRWKSEECYLTNEEIYEILDSAYISAINWASLEVEEGRYEAEELEEKVDKVGVLNDAMLLLSS